MAIYTPSLEEVDVLAETGNWIPIYRELPADLETPVSAYLKLRTGKPSFLLESVEGGERLARYSFLGSEPLFTLFSKGDKVRLDKRGEEEIPLNGADPLHFIKKNLGQYKVAHLPDLPRFLGGAVGYLSYDMVRFLEELPATAEDDLHLPECYFLFTDTGSHMRLVELDPLRNTSVIELDEGGEQFRIVRGDLRRGPTSELMPHLRVHMARKRAPGSRSRTVIHTHPPNLIALTYALELDTASLTRLLWAGKRQPLNKNQSPK